MLFYNATRVASFQQMKYLVDSESIQQLFNTIHILENDDDAEITTIMMESLKCLLKVGETDTLIHKTLPAGLEWIHLKGILKAKVHTLDVEDGDTDICYLSCLQHV